MPSPSPSVAPLSGFLRRLAVGPPQSSQTLTLWPLLAPLDPSLAGEPPWVPLSTALEAGDALVDEVDADGSVPHVRVVNRRARPLLVLFGDEIVGAKQDRIANASFLVPGKRELVIDVSCVEQGRWDRRPGTCFRAGRGLASASLRRRVQSHVREARVAGGNFRSDQFAVWEDVQERIEKARIDSETFAYEDYVESRTPDVQALCAAFHPVPGQVGFVAALGGSVVGLEAIGHPSVFAAAFQRLLHSYAIDAGEVEQGATAPGRFASPEPFLAALAAAPATSGASLGAGEDVRLAGQGVGGCALLHDAVVHVCGFADAP